MNLTEKQNAPTDYLNPSVEPVVQIYLRHNLLQGFGTGVNGRFIRVAEKNIQAAQETFRSQLLERCCQRFESVLGFSHR